jgi:hypothetical protein
MIGSHSIREIIVGSNATEKKYFVKYCSLCSKWRFGKVDVKGLILKKHWNYKVFYLQKQ